MIFDNLIAGFKNFGGFGSLIGSYGSDALKIINYLGPLLVLVLYILILLNMFVYLMNILPLLYLLYGPITAWFISISGLYLAMNVWFNHSLGMMVKPGNLKDFYYPELSQEDDKMRKEDVKRHRTIQSSCSDLSSLMKFSHCDVNEVDDPNGKHCTR